MSTSRLSNFSFDKMQSLTNSMEKMDTKPVSMAINNGGKTFGPEFDHLISDYISLQNQVKGTFESMKRESEEVHRDFSEKENEIEDLSNRIRRV